MISFDLFVTLKSCIQLWVSSIDRIILIAGRMGVLSIRSQNEVSITHIDVILSNSYSLIERSLNIWWRLSWWYLIASIEELITICTWRLWATISIPKWSLNYTSRVFSTIQDTFIAITLSYTCFITKTWPNFHQSVQATTYNLITLHISTTADIITKTIYNPSWYTQYCHLLHCWYYWKLITWCLKEMTRHHNFQETTMVCASHISPKVG